MVTVNSSPTTYRKKIMGTIVDIDNTILTKGIFPMVKNIRTINGLPDVFLITGRMESERANTVKALRDAGVKYRSLLMNTSGSSAPNMQIRSKRQNASKVMAHNDITMAIDDNPTARAMYKTLGIGRVVAP